MALHPEFPLSPYDELLPEHRWVPGVEQREDTAYEKLLPPLVAHVRKHVKAWRDDDYAGASSSSRALLHWWFETDHLIEQADGTSRPFEYYFAQREAVESVIWLYDVKQARDKFDLLRFDASGAVSHGMFPEDWPRYVLKLATGAGKTKVLSLLIAWCFFHKTYEPGSQLARNILLIAPNIIVLDRLRADFDGLKIFFEDPVLPANGHAGRNWHDDFQLALHVQDDVRITRPTGNLFLTNIHRVFFHEAAPPSADDENTLDYFLEPFGPRPVGKTTDSRVDLGELIREIDELAVFNDEAHHIHDERLAWFGSIRDIHSRLLQKDRALSLQIDVSATPRHNNGSIFVQTVSDYPLVEAIAQNVLKHPVLPDAESRGKLSEAPSAIFHEKYADYLQLAVTEWRASYAEHEKLGQKAVLFVMVDDTKNCDDVGRHLEQIAPELAGGVLVIHTKRNGEISEAATGKKAAELELLRKQSNTIDSWDSPYKAIVSVLMLKEGWDVRNVTTICGLRAYSAQSNILPEQTLGRGLRRMYFGSDMPETVSVLGTPAFMEFVEIIEIEGVELEYKAMGDQHSGASSLIVEIDHDNTDKDINALDIALPRLSRRFDRGYDNLQALDPANLNAPALTRRNYDLTDTRQIDFHALLGDGEVHHSIHLAPGTAGDWRSAVGFFARALVDDLKIAGGYALIYPRVKAFVRDHLFDDAPVDLDDLQVLRALAEPGVIKVVFDSFRAGINALTVVARDTVAIDGWLKLSDTRPFRMQPRKCLVATRSPFNKIVAEAQGGGLEMAFANWLEHTGGVASFAKNYLAVGFKLDYIKHNGELSHYIPDFIVRGSDGAVVLIETKGRVDIDVPNKMNRLKQWCADASAADSPNRYIFVYVDEHSFKAHPPSSLGDLIATYRDFQ